MLFLFFETIFQFFYGHTLVDYFFIPSPDFQTWVWLFASVLICKNKGFSMKRSVFGNKYLYLVELKLCKYKYLLWSLLFSYPSRKLKITNTERQSRGSIRGQTRISWEFIKNNIHRSFREKKTTNLKNKIFFYYNHYRY